MKILKSIFTLSLLVTTLLFPLESAESKPSKCQAAADDISKEIKSLGVQAVEQVINPDFNNDGSLAFILGKLGTKDNSSITDIMISQRLHVKWALEIFKNCHDTHLLSIAVYHSDYILDYITNNHGESIYFVIHPEMGCEMHGLDCEIHYEQVY